MVPLIRTFVIVLLALTACGEQDPAVRPKEAPGQGPAVAATHPDSAAIGRLKAQLPAELLARGNACPFECCVYGDWLADSDIPLHDLPRATGTPSFMLQKGQKMRADSGVVYITSLAFAVVDDTVVRYADRRSWLLPGDTLVLLEPIGEGYWTMWRRGEVLQEVPPFFDSSSEPKRGRLIGTPRHEWWVHASAPGRSGWFNADSAEILGADACGGPVEGL
ncbi:MAG TPA: hypothetical protein VGD27_16100 [Longimicrobiales bacterium]